MELSHVVFVLINPLQIRIIFYGPQNSNTSKPLLRVVASKFELSQFCIQGKVEVKQCRSKLREILLAEPSRIERLYKHLPHFLEWPPLNSNAT